jgi:hypothetical protein
MSNENQKQEDKRTAVQKLSDVENVVVQLYGAFDNATKDLTLLKNAVRLLNNKVDAMVKATVSGEGISDAVIERIMIENSVADLTNKTANLVLSGVIAPEEQVSENSFVVGNDSDDTGKVVNPRLQFALKALPPDLQSKLIGKRVGDTVQFTDSKLTFKVLETYKIQEQQAPTTPETAPTASEATAEAAPTAQ